MEHLAEFGGWEFLKWRAEIWKVIVAYYSKVYTIDNDDDKLYFDRITYYIMELLLVSYSGYGIFALFDNFYGKIVVRLFLMATDTFVQLENWPQKRKKPKHCVFYIV